MKQLKISTLFGWLVPTLTLAFFAAEFLVQNGEAIPAAGFEIIVTLPLLGLAVVFMAIPIFKYRKAMVDRKIVPRVNPFYAVRVVLLAKAVAISGAIFIGWHAGLAWAQFSSPVVTDAIWQNLWAMFGGLVMVVCGLIVERNCRVPEDDKTDGAAA
jgi:hypothetical protein